jgi:hypothetical protein
MPGQIRQMFLAHTRSNFTTIQTAGIHKNEYSSTK